MRPPGEPGRWTAFGPGKIILLGEHAVVYGHTALAGALSWGVTATGIPARRCSLAIPAAVRGHSRRLLVEAFAAAAGLCGNPGVRVSIESDLPVSTGLGSSAALSVATARLLLQASGRAVTPARVNAVALRMEQAFHGTPSGVDHACSARGTLIAFRRSRTGRPVVRALASRRPLKVLVAIAGRRGSTHETVRALRLRQARWPKRYGRLFAEMGKLAEEGAAAVESGDLETLGDAMNVNHGLLTAVGVSSPALDALVATLRRAGALGAKLTGAGGDGGAVVGLFLEPERAVSRLSRAGLSCFASHLAGPRSL